MTLLKRILPVALLLATKFLYGQELVDVDPYTGSAVINIPLTSIHSGSIGQQVSISFIGNGIKANAPSGTLGVGWNLHAGGSITRNVKGLPDDYYNTGTGAENKKGWLVDGTHSLAGGYTSMADGDLGTCEDEGVDYTYLRQFGGFNAHDTIRDTEPDIFHINAPGLNAGFVFDNNGEIQFLQHSNHTIEYFYDTLQRLAGFKVITDAGLTYIFGDPVQGYLTTTKTEDSVWDMIEEMEEPEFFKREYYMYKGMVRFNRTWSLLSISNTSGDRMDFDYAAYKIQLEGPSTYTITPGNFSFGNENYDVYLYDGTTGSYKKKPQFFIKEYFGLPRELVSIRTPERRIEFLKNEMILRQGAYQLKNALLNWINVYDLTGDGEALLRRYVFDYGLIKKRIDYGDLNEDFYTHIFLKSLKEVTLDHEAPPYVFEYYGVDLENETSLLADRGTKYTDIYGYMAATDKNSGQPPAVYVYPDLDEANRYRYFPIPGYQGEYFEIEGHTYTTDLSKISIGSLKSITRPGGGNINIDYEPNEYYDGLTGRNFYGGGLRVRKVVITDGTGYNNRLVKRYTYETGSGASTGRKLYQPQYDFQLGHYHNPNDYTNTYYPDLQHLSDLELFRHLNVRTTRDMNKAGGAYVGYEKVQVKQEGKGITEIQYSIPVTYETRNTSDGWAASSMKMARNRFDAADSVRCYDIADLTGPYKYPFIANPRYGRQGIMKKMTMYDEQGHKTRSVEHEYEDVGSPKPIKALYLDQYKSKVDNYMVINGQGTWYTSDNPYFIYGQYPLTTGDKLVRALTTETNFLASDSLRTMSSQMASTYNNDDNKYLKEAISTSNDGTRYITTYRYASDINYKVSGTWLEMDEMSKALFKFETMSMEHVPVEIVNIKVTDTDTLVVDGKLNVYAYNAEYNQVNLVARYALQASKPKREFTPSSITSDNNYASFVMDAGYQLIESYSDFDARSRPGSVTGYDHTASSQLYDAFGKVRASFSDAQVSQIVFADFENDGNASPVYDGAYLEEGYISGHAYDMTNGPALSAALTKKGNRYVFSCRTKLNGTSGTLDLVVSDGVNSLTTPVSVSGSEWTFFQQDLDLGNLGNSLNISLSGSGVAIDDIAIYPYSASYEQYYYGGKGQMVATVNMDNKHTYYEYDLFNRLHVVRDNEKNIIKRTRYSQKNDNSLWEPNITYKHDKYTYGIINFSSSLPYLDGKATFKWKIKKYSDYNHNYQNVVDDNDYSQFPSLTVSSFDYTFDEPGTYAIKLQVQYAGETKTEIKIIDIGNEPLKVRYEANHKFIDACDPPQQLSITVVVGGGSGDYSYEWYYTYPGSFFPDTRLNATTATFSTTDFLFNGIYWCIVTDNVTGRKNSKMSFSPIQISVFASDPSCELPNEQ